MTVVAGMFERGDDPERPFNTLVARGATSADYRKIHLYDSFGYRESDRLSAGAPEPVLVEAGLEADVVTAVLDHTVLEQARRTNPSLANRRL